MALVPIRGLMAAFTADNGKTVACRVWESKPGLTVESTKVSFRTTKCRGMVSSPNKMVKYTKECGVMASNMVKVLSRQRTAARKKVSGQMVLELIG